ncbi:2Fe-2S iron-sulfur cluster-binding protein [uncultured Roseobacter sp.]|uniref:2Fe-2S iron-sulfur cluster-binding protein n=1 Tax=uncultured Roseobacter sp. TaxID=114847 RepID=UPI0026263937|nr:2Fe-2S iron-sulfur cluster-binding protein [uncultured Roseobacter sp.]
MARFHELTVTDVRKTIRDAVVVTLAPRNGGNFDFIQGQYLTFRRAFDGVEVRRSYSICSGRNEGVLQVGIKKVDGGAFSNWANEELQPGMVVEAMEPMGSFHAALDPDAAKTYLGFAGGSGITPVLSILKTVLAEEPKSQFTLVYANRGVNTIMFREDLEDLKNRYMGRLSVIHVLESDAQEIELFRGRVDEEKCAALFEHWIDITSVDTAFICGPEPMMLGISAALKDHGLTKDQIKFELFKSAQPGRLTRKVSSDLATSRERSTQAQVTLDGASVSFDMDRETTVLEAALANALDAPHACKAGVCSTCKCKVIEGEVEMVANHALEDYEVERGFILSCQSFPITDTLVVDYDQH